MKHRRIFYYSVWSDKIQVHQKRKYKDLVDYVRSDAYWFNGREIWYGVWEKREIKKYLGYYNLLYT